MEQSTLTTRAIREIEEALLGITESASHELATAISGSNRVVVFGLGREMLALRAFAMRLMHHGIDAHVAGDVTAKRVGRNDLVIVSAGPGDLPLADTMVGLADNAGARTIVLTAQPTGPVPRRADSIIFIPAQTMANDMGAEGVLPMGSVYEIAMMIFLDLVAVRLRELTNQSIDQVRERHFNLE